MPPVLHRFLAGPGLVFVLAWVLASVLAIPPRAISQSSSTFDVFEEVSVHNLTGTPPSWHTVRLQGPLFDDVTATGIASVDLDPSTPRPELLIYQGTTIACYDFDQTSCGGPAIPTPPAAVEALVGLTRPLATTPSLYMANGSDLWRLDLGSSAWLGPEPQGFQIAFLAAANVMEGSDEELIATDGTTVFARDLTQATAQWTALPAPPPGPIDSIAGVDVGFASDGDPAGNRRLLAVHQGGTTHFFDPEAAGGPAWTLPYTRRFGISSAAPVDFFSEPATPVGNAVAPTALDPTDIRLRDVATEVGLGQVYRPAGDGHCPGVVFTDLDGDGLADLYLPRGVRNENGTPVFKSNLLFLNDGAGGFTESASAPGAADPRNSAGALAADFVGDDRRDLYVINFRQGNRLFERTDTGYVDVTDTTDPTPGVDDNQAGLGVGCDDGETEPDCTLDATLAAAAGDFDRDGDLDLYVGNQLCCPPNFSDGQRDVLYLNRGDGTFEDITYSADIEEPGVALNSSTQALLVADFDDDRWPDIFLTHKGIGPDPRREELFLNDGDADGDGVWDGTFTEYFGEQSDPVLGAVTCAAMGIDAADYDGDGDLDVFLTDISGVCTEGVFTHMDLYRNLLADSGYFDLELVLPNPVASPDFAWGASWSDLDNDGDQDLHVSTAVDRMNYLHENLGGDPPAFADVTVASGAAVARGSRSSVPADFDRDGFVDLLVAHREPVPVTLFRNETLESPNRRSLSIQLVGNPFSDETWQSTREAVGARIEVTTHTGTLRRDIYAGGHSCASTRDYVAHFGVGDASTVSVRVLWPSGAESVVPDQATCETAPCPVVEIVEP